MKLLTSLLEGSTSTAAPDAARRRWLLAGAACCVGGVWPINPARAQAPEVQRHLDAATRAAGSDLLSYLKLSDPLRPGFQPQKFDMAAAIQRPAPSPGQAFDNLYFVGSDWVSAWAITTREGILLVDAMNNDEEAQRVVVGGLKQLGLDPAQVRTIVVTHGHGDHYGGVGVFKRQFNSRVVMSDRDWSMTETKLEFDSPLWGPVPKRDVSVKDGDVVRLGEQAMQIVVTPGHTMGTISPVFEVRDGATKHTAMLWGGTGFNFGRKPERMQAFADAAARARQIARERGVDVLISNHGSYDRAVEKLQLKKAGAPNPFVMGADGVQRALTVLQECALATLASWTT